MKFYFLILSILGMTSCQSLQHQNDVVNSIRVENKEYPAVTLQNTLIRNFHSNVVGIDYKLYVGLPKKYSDTKTLYPIIFVLDADYFFSVVQNIMTDGADHNELAQAIIVGITYPGVAEDKHGPVFEKSRTRDYTPTHVAKGGYGKEAQKLSGGADRFLDFLNDELIPFMETEFRVSPQDRTIVGISYGGLFSSYALISRPTLFQKLIIISPSLWWDRRFVFRTVNKKVATFKDIHAKVFFSAGSLEKGEGKVADMGKDIKDFASEIESQHFPGFEAKVWIAPNEIHHSVFCGAASRGLRYLFEIPSKKK